MLPPNILDKIQIGELTLPLIRTDKSWRIRSSTEAVHGSHTRNHVLAARQHYLRISQGRCLSHIQRSGCRLPLVRYNGTDIGWCCVVLVRKPSTQTLVQIQSQLKNTKIKPIGHSEGLKLFIQVSPIGFLYI